MYRHDDEGFLGTNFGAFSRKKQGNLHHGRCSRQFLISSFLRFLEQKHAYFYPTFLDVLMSFYNKQIFNVFTYLSLTVWDHLPQGVGEYTPRFQGIESGLKIQFYVSVSRFCPKAQRLASQYKEVLRLFHYFYFVLGKIFVRCSTL